MAKHRNYTRKLITAQDNAYQTPSIIREGAALDRPARLRSHNTLTLSAIEPDAVRTATTTTDYQSRAPRFEQHLQRTLDDHPHLQEPAAWTGSAGPHDCPSRSCTSQPHNCPLHTRLSGPGAPDTRPGPGAVPLPHPCQPAWLRCLPRARPH